MLSPRPSPRPPVGPGSGTIPKPPRKNTRVLQLHDLADHHVVVTCGVHVAHLRVHPQENTGQLDEREAR
ncbi:hypothetical protein [Saccharopolyspora tripterygii]